MYKYQAHSDTIAAIATAPGAGGVAIVRLSGERSAEILGKIFTAGSKALPLEWKANVLHYGWVRDPSGVIIDEALAVVMRAPKSFTAEDVAEIHTHGGVSAARAVLELCLAKGARLAEPGEFTRRAFLNGRIDLSQAEAVADMVAARTDLMLRAACHQLKGDLFRELEAIRELLITVYSHLEAVLNFPEDDTERQQRESGQQTLSQALRRINALLATARQGMALREGVRMVICGKPNAGKSSLLNALLKHSRAIVTDIAGTTRDTLEEAANIKGIPVNLVDTAGILEPRDKIEAEAVRRSRASIESADIVLLVLDRSQPLEEVDRSLMAQAVSGQTVIVLNKCDLLPAFSLNDLNAVAPEHAGIEVSTLTRHGLMALEDLLVQRALNGDLPEAQAVVLTNMRHIEALRNAAHALEQSVSALEHEGPFEIISDGVKAAVNSLDAVTGRNIDADALDRIFASFCIGK